MRAAGEQLARGSDFASSLQVECSRGACKRDRILQAPRKWDTPRTLTARSRGEGRRQQQQKQTVCAHLACILQRHCTHSAPALQAAHALDLFANLPVSGFANFSRWPAARRRRHLHRLLSNLATFRALSHSLPSAAGKLVGGNEKERHVAGGIKSIQYRWSRGKMMPVKRTSIESCTGVRASGERGFEKAKQKLDLEVDGHLCARETRQVSVSGSRSA